MTIYATAASRNNLGELKNWRSIHKQVSSSSNFQRELWERYASTEEYEMSAPWGDTLDAIQDILSRCEAYWTPYKTRNRKAQEHIVDSSPQ